jgi:predicted SprT family Zn-dependent metalloprotease
MMFRYFMLGSAILWSASIWFGLVGNTTAQNTENVELGYTPGIVKNGDLFLDEPARKDPRTALSDNFWQWEAKGRLALIDKIIDDENLTSYRLDWAKADKGQDLIEGLITHVVDIQMQSYDVADKFESASVQFIPLRGDANGLYIPKDKTIYINSRMAWDQLSFERLMEVVLHENMHHIMTTMFAVLSEQDELSNDFASLHRAAYFHDTSGMAQDSQDLYQVNPQELVAWTTQRAARYAGIMGAGLPSWDMTARMQELRYVREQAGFKN